MITMAGVAIALEASDEPRWAALDALFGTCRASTDAPRVTVALGATPPDAPSGEPAVRFSDVELWFTDHGAITRHASGLVVRRDGGSIRAGGPDSGIDLPRAFRRSVQHVLVDALADHGRHALHAAAFARHDRAVVVLGDTGAGKSTLAIGAAGAGWSVLTDDISWLSVTPDGLAVTGFPKPLHVPADLRAQVPDAATRLVGDVRGRYISARGLTSDDVPRQLMGVVEVRHGLGDGALAPLPPGPHLMAMAIASFPLQDDPARTKQFFPVAARLGRLPAVTLSHAADPDVRAERAATLLDAAWTMLLACSGRDAAQ